MIVAGSNPVVGAKFTGDVMTTKTGNKMIDEVNEMTEKQLSELLDNVVNFKQGKLSPVLTDTAVRMNVSKEALANAICFRAAIFFREKFHRAYSDAGWQYQNWRSSI